LELPVENDSYFTIGFDGGKSSVSTRFHSPA
jgi:hypothetical protein